MQRFDSFINSNRRQERVTHFQLLVVNENESHITKLSRGEDSTQSKDRVFFNNNPFRSFPLTRGRLGWD